MRHQRMLTFARFAAGFTETEIDDKLVQYLETGSTSELLDLAGEVLEETVSQCDSEVGARDCFQAFLSRFVPGLDDEAFDGFFEPVKADGKWVLALAED